MVELFKQWRSVNLVLRIFIGLVIGVVLALVVPDSAVVSLFGKIFVGLLKGIAPVLVFVLIISALANATGNIGSRFKTVIFLYMAHSSAPLQIFYIYNLKPEIILH